MLEYLICYTFIQTLLNCIVHGTDSPYYSFVEHFMTPVSSKIKDPELWVEMKIFLPNRNENDTELSNLKMICQDGIVFDVKPFNSSELCESQSLRRAYFFNYTRAAHTPTLSAVLPLWTRFDHTLKSSSSCKLFGFLNRQSHEFDLISHMDAVEKTPSTFWGDFYLLKNWMDTCSIHQRIRSGHRVDSNSFLETSFTFESSSSTQFEFDDPSTGINEFFFSFVDVSERVHSYLRSGIRSKQVVAVAVDNVKQQLQQLLIQLFEKTVLPPVNKIVMGTLEPILMSFLMDMSALGVIEKAQNVPSGDFEASMAPFLGLELESGASMKFGGGSVTKQLKANFVTTMANELLANDQLEASQILHSSLGDSLAVVVNRTVSRSASRSVLVSLTESLTVSLLDLLVHKFEESLVPKIAKDVTRVLTPSLTHSLGSNIRKSLSRNPLDDYYCMLCASKEQYCEECMFSMKSEYYHDYLDSIYSRYYSSWYTRFYMHPSTIKHFIDQ